MSRAFSAALDRVLGKVIDLPSAGIEKAMDGSIRRYRRSKQMQKLAAR